MREAETSLGRDVARGGLHGVGSLFAAKSDVVALEFAIEGGATDTEHFAGERLLEDAQDGHALHFRQSGGGKGSGFRAVWRLGTRGLLRADGGRQVFDVHHLMIPERYSASDAVLQFADVARPVVLQQALHGW